MKKVAAFCIPAHGHTNPMLPVLRELVRRGDEVRFYSFDEFRSRIESTGAAFVSLDAYLPELNTREEEKLRQVSQIDMTIQDIRVTLALNDFMESEFKTFRPDVVYTDSVCFWGKLNAMKYHVPMVVSTSTFAFNRMSSQYMKNSPREIAGLICGMPRANRELKKLDAFGYRHKGLLSLVQSDNQTDSVVYTSRRFQPFAESFSDHYTFVGPSVFSDRLPDKAHARPLVYISMGTVINDRPDLYRRCIEALRDENVDVIISCGQTVNIASLGELPANVSVYPRVDQLEVLSRANAFITHCGMNSVSESLYMAAPMALYPQTNEQEAVARRVREIGAGISLKDDSAAGIRAAIRELLEHPEYAKAAKACSDDFRGCSGPAGAADFIESAPHTSDGPDIIAQMNKANVRHQVLYSILTIAAGTTLFRFIDPKFLWIYIPATIALSGPFNKALEKLAYRRLTQKLR